MNISPEAYSAMHKTWYGDGNLTEEEHQAVKEMHGINNLGESDVNIYLRRSLRNAYKKYLKQGKLNQDLTRGSLK